MQPTFSGSDHKLKPIEQLKKGEFFRLKGGKQVYTAEGYCRYNRKYTGTNYDDINRQTYKKKGTLIEYDFEF